jgi:hypothetical protein
MPAGRIGERAVEREWIRCGTGAFAETSQFLSIVNYGRKGRR